MAKRADKKLGGILGKEHYLNLVLYLDAVGEANARPLAEIGNHYKTSAQMQHMKQLGLVSIRKESSPRVAFFFSLTEKGTALASKLKEAKAIIEGE